MQQYSYCEFMDEISPEELYEGLLAHGFFAEKCPPVFSSIHFYEYCKELPEPFKDGRSEYISYRSMRNTGIPRLLGIPNPMKYQKLCIVLKENWDIIRAHFHEQTDEQAYRVSRIHIRKEHDEKRIFKMNYKNWRVDGNPESDLLIHDRGTSRYLVKADISTCFPSIYTHAIPWALVGKHRAKTTITDDTWYNAIDKACRGMNYGETHGLLIGPHASNVLSEIILTVIDKKLYEKGYKFIRNIDDYDCYIDNYDNAKRFLRDLEVILHEFDLALNHKKTRIMELPIEIEKNWKHKLSDLPVTAKDEMTEYPQVNTFIDTALSLARKNEDYAIINYAIKKLKNLTLSDNAKKLAAKRIMHLAVLHPYLLHLMDDYVFQPYSVNKDRIRDLSEAIFRDAVKTNDFESICFALYYAIKYDFTLRELEDNYDKAIEYFIEHKDCLTLVMAWIYYMKNNKWNRRATQVKPFNRLAWELKKTDMDRYWLFCYEVLTFGSLSGEWRTMKQNGVSFMRENLKGDHQKTR